MTNATTPTPGNEIRVKCAELMGVNTKHARFWHQSHSGMKWWEFSNRADAEHFHATFGLPDHPIQDFTRIEWLPTYEQSCDAAMELVAALKKEGWAPEMPINHDGYTWRFIRWRECDEEVSIHEATAATLPLAIALAFLATKGLEP